MPIPSLACMALVAAYHHLPPRVLPAIQAVEGGSVGTIERNRDGSEDLGLMQVNTLWLPTMAVLAGTTPEQVRHRLLTDPCFNIAAAGAILAQYRRAEAGDLMRAIGDYHSHTAALNQRYQGEVTRAAGRLFGQPRR